MLIPIDAIGSRITLAMSQMRGQLINFPLVVPAGGWSDRPTLDGLLLTDTAYTNEAEFGYVHVRRNGILEAVVSDATHRNRMGPNSPTFFSYDVLGYFFGALSKYLAAYSALKVPPPVYCLLSFIGVRGMRFSADVFTRFSNPVAEEDILLPKVEVRELVNVNAPALFRDTLDILWNAGGHGGCTLYDDQGNFRWR